MDKELWQQIQGIFRHLSDKSPSHRRDYLDMVCETQPELRREVEALLESHDRLERDGRDLAAPVAHAASEMQRPCSVADYRIVEELGRGGMGVVYRAEHPLHGRVALKLLPRFAVASEQAQSRFSQEARILGDLRHPALCGLCESFTTEDYAAIAMEFIDGRGLDEHIDDRPLALDRCLEIMLELADVLELAHARGLVHRDIKSNNILIDSNGQTRLIDFGIAKFADTRLTRTGQVIGTPGYMSPEQWQGRGIDHRTDLWSLGVLLYEMLTARRPFEADGQLEMARMVLDEAPPKLPVSACSEYTRASLQSIIDDLLAKDPAARLPSCRELSERIRALR